MVVKYKYPMHALDSLFSHYQSYALISLLSQHLETRIVHSFFGFSNAFPLFLVPYGNIAMPLLFMLGLFEFDKDVYWDIVRYSNMAVMSALIIAQAMCLVRSKYKPYCFRVMFMVAKHHYFAIVFTMMFSADAMFHDRSAKDIANLALGTLCLPVMGYVNYF